MTKSSTRHIYFTVSELTHLLVHHNLTKEGVTFKIASHRLTCRINDCEWQGSDNGDLNNHIRAAHRGDTSNTGKCESQVVLAEHELQQLAVNSTDVIEGNTYHVVEAVRFLFAVGGGKWYSTGSERLYTIQSQLSAKETDLLKQVRDIERQKEEELAIKHEMIKEQQDASKAAQSEIKQLKEEIVKQQGKRNELETSLIAKEEGLTYERANLAVLQESDKAHRNLATEQSRQICALKATLHAKTGLINDSISIHKRFFVYVKEGMIDRSKTPYSRSELSTKIVNSGNDVAHRANVISHIAVFKAEQLTVDEIETFKQMYGFHPAKFGDMLVTPKLIEMWNMMGTMAACLARIKFGTSGSKRYREFQSLSAAVNAIRLSAEAAGGKGEEAKQLFDKDEDFLHKLKAMKGIVDEFTALDKLERSERN